MFGTCVAETILASVHVRTQQQAGHMDASDQIKLSRISCESGAVHIWESNHRLRERGAVILAAYVLAIPVRHEAHEEFELSLQ